MAGVVRLASISEGSIDAEHGRASFVLRFASGQTLTCISDLAEIEQMNATLGRIAQSVRRSSPQSVIAKNVLAYGVASDDAAGTLLLRLTTPGGISHIFALGKDWARNIADQLTSEASEK